ncbi:hypothetical protein ACFQRC_06180 [Enterovirga sp. GCM10030262]|uniref:hypothetical protein n=1 Tax=Enterovirga sp. GCM10030262 TaxID=3273391 RepID=UPI00360EF282
MRIASVILLIGLAGCADPGNGQAGSANMVAITIHDAQGEPTDCGLAIRFGSYAMGIDGVAARKVEALVAGDPGARSAARHRWGREGEYTLCVETTSDAAAKALFGRIMPILPATPRGPIQLILRDGARHDAPPR